MVMYMQVARTNASDVRMCRISVHGSEIFDLVHERYRTSSVVSVGPWVVPGDGSVRWRSHPVFNTAFRGQSLGSGISQRLGQNKRFS